MPKNFSALLQASPNLYNLTIYFTTLQLFFDDDSICRLLGQQITHLKIHLHSQNIKLDNFPMARLVSTFSNLKYLCFLNGYYRFGNVESFILSIINRLSEWNSLVSFSISNICLKEETRSKGIQYWVSEHISNNRLFLVDYTDNEFRLWL